MLKAATCLGDLAELGLADVVQVLLHVRRRLAHLLEGELGVDEHLGHHGLRAHTQRLEVLLSNQ